MKPVDQLGKCPQDVSPGYRDAFHVVVVLSKLKSPYVTLVPGGFIRFIKPDLSEFVHVTNKYDSHGVVDPFVDPDSDGPYWIIMKPGLTKNVRHHFDIIIAEEELNDNEKDGDSSDECRYC